ncbi:alpha-1,3-mannosyltransferase CMT1 [Cladophialophora carrionii]|uniref:Alpha-1,3-mannosyltransferase CMT1 n=1 Tax=Cladophialophora carrionii TaxID=86049 RepID=A0A1C1CWM5_9EURO|nr:alpha-1,3-mannosyltransferase CMT1 [Cladophialophora carrionii]
MRKFAVSLGQTLLLLILFVLIEIQQLHEQPLIDRVLDSLQSVSNGTRSMSRSPTDLSFPYQSSNWSTSRLPLLTPAPHYPTPKQSENTARLMPTPSHPHTLTSHIKPGLLHAETIHHLTSIPASRQSTVPQILQVDCDGRSVEHGFLSKVNDFVDSVMGSGENGLPRLQCPPLNSTRYSTLHHLFPSTRPSYFFAMNFHQSAHVIPQLLGAIVEAVRFLGPDRCVISVVEGRSTDGTFEILKSLVKEMEHLGVSYFLSCNELQPGADGMERISTLAELRNLALQPLTRNPDQFDLSTTIIFLNDIVPCGEDILELILQRALLEADMTCGMDWYNLGDGEGGTFYDSWIGRQMNGETFFEVPQSTSWDFSKNLFWDHETSKLRYSLGQPLQVFSCWNGAAAIGARPFVDGRIRFRTQVPGECHLGEPVHLAKDLWRLGYGKIAVIPSVNLGYSVEDSIIAKDAHGWVSKMVEQGSMELNRIVWQEKPPGQIKCLEGDWHKPSWEPFDLDT